MPTMWPSLFVSQTSTLPKNASKSARSIMQLLSVSMSAKLSMSSGRCKFAHSYVFLSARSDSFTHVAPPGMFCMRPDHSASSSCCEWCCCTLGMKNSSRSSAVTFPSPSRSTCGKTSTSSGRCSFTASTFCSMSLTVTCWPALVLLRATRRLLMRRRPLHTSSSSCVLGLGPGSGAAREPAAGGWKASRLSDSSTDTRCESLPSGIQVPSRSALSASLDLARFRARQPTTPWHLPGVSWGGFILEITHSSESLHPRRQPKAIGPFLPIDLALKTA
mmetsp:Transcript_91790/g.259818  ORF Transcript_91790/g.259818 Transcript_91790/m.259818 type:complete len:275 (-) Transcript_91790:160-984(-)